MRRLLELLSDIKLWSILGVLVTILTVIITIRQHQSTNILFSLHARNNVEIKENQPMLFIILSADKINESVKRVRVPAPVGFYNPNREAVEIEYAVKNRGVGCTLSPTEYTKTKVLREYGKILDFDFVFDAEQLRKGNIVNFETAIMWSYENMTDRCRANLQVRCLTNVQSYVENSSKGRLVVVYVPDFASSTREEVVYKVLDEDVLAKIMSGKQ